MVVLRLVLLLLSLLLGAAFAQRRLIQLQMLVRHGMRAPDQWFPEDPNPAGVWREGPGQLTQHGKQQQYRLGQHLRRLYENFISSSPVEVEVMSSQRKRCVSSALCLASALLRPEPEWQFAPGLPWQPVPVFYAATSKKDPYLGKVFNCPVARDLLSQSRRTKEARRFFKKNKALFEFLSENSGWDIKFWSDAATLYDILFMHKLYHHTVPEWADEVWNELEMVTNAHFYFLGQAEAYQRLRAGPLLDLMLDKMKKAIEGISQKKLRIYSGHSKNLIAVLSALGVYNDVEPPFCSTILWELYEEEPGSNSVRLLFLNSTTPGEGEPQTLIIPSCGGEEFCPFDKYKRFLRGFVTDWEKECPDAMD